MVEPQQDYHIKSLVYLKETPVYGIENGQMSICLLSSFDNNNKESKQRIQTSSNVLSLCKISKDVGHSNGTINIWSKQQQQQQQSERYSLLQSVVEDNRTIDLVN
jgi:DNA-binding transcriptional regulator/RsmH inhibitor MraZ